MSQRIWHHKQKVVMEGLTRSTSCTVFLATDSSFCSAQQVEEAEMMLRRPVEGNRMRRVTWGVLQMACKLVTNLHDTDVWEFHV